MYKNFIGKDVEIIICTRTDQLLEYTGKLVEVSNEELLLEDAMVNFSLTEAAKNASALNARVFGGNATILKSHVASLVLNKEYIISCHLV